MVRQVQVNWYNISKLEIKIGWTEEFETEAIASVLVSQVCFITMFLMGYFMVAFCGFSSLKKTQDFHLLVISLKFVEP